MKATEEFLKFVFVAAAKEILATQQLTLQEVLHKIANNFPRTPCIVMSLTKIIYMWCELITLGLCWYGCKDATREGDGETHL